MVEGRLAEHGEGSHATLVFRSRPCHCRTCLLRCPPFSMPWRTVSTGVCTDASPNSWWACCSLAAGGFPLPDGYLPRLRQLCDRYGILLIADEVITGFGRTGALFGVDHEGVVPDLMVLAKGLTAGYVPMGAVILRESLAQSLEKRMLPLGSNYAAHPLAGAAALACMEETEE